MEMDKIKNRVRGSLVGGAVGDALGYPVEFLSYNDILRVYGDNGITRYDLADSERALISDDTQMTLYTACGLINAKKSGVSIVEAVKRAYLEWLYTQRSITVRPYKECWITELLEVNALRAPGNTCLSALKSIAANRAVVNDSKGCGGVMRIAPIALYGVAHGIENIKVLDTLSAELSKMTHQHPLGYIPSAFVNHLIYRLATSEDMIVDDVRGFVGESLVAVSELYPDNWRDIEVFASLIHSAILLAENEDMTDIEAIAELGGGWVAEETVAIAVYCTLRHFDDFESAVVAAVNHSGDSDSTGAVTGNIMGAIVGYSAIPQHFKRDLEHHDIILAVADDICNL